MHPSHRHRKSFSPSYERQCERQAFAREIREHAQEASNFTKTVEKEPAEEAINPGNIILRTENAEEASTEKESVVNEENTLESENREEEAVEAFDVNDDKAEKNGGLGF